MRRKAHKYLVSYTRIGLVARDRGGTKYVLGPFALEIGLASLRRNDVMELAQSAIEELRDMLGTTASVAVWANRGVTLVRWAETPNISSNAIKLGTVLPVLLTATGRIFGAHLDPEVSAKTIEKELANPAVIGVLKTIKTRQDVDLLFAQVRNDGFSRCEGIPEMGRCSASAPILDANNEILAALAIVGVQNVLDLSRGGKPVTALVDKARDISRRLGAKL